MKIVHICLACFYLDDCGYQENLLPLQNLKDGHEVTIITSTLNMDVGTKRYVYTKRGEYQSNGLKVIRLNYKWPIGNLLNSKLRIYKNLYNKLENEKPDLIFIHGLQFLDLKVVTKYLTNHKECVALSDSHTEYDNSANGFISKEILHKKIYAKAIQKNIKCISKIYYIGYECGEFFREMYKIYDKLEFLSLGGNLVEENVAQTYKNQIRLFYNIGKNELLFLHTGKFNDLKKTLEVVEVFGELFTSQVKLFLIGFFEDSELEKKVKAIISKHQNIIYLGWKDQVELEKFLCAADLLIQPGSKSAIFQQGICCGTPIILGDMKNNKFLLSKHNGFIVKDREELERSLLEVNNNPEILKEFHVNAQQFAKESLSYSALANRIYLEYQNIKKERGY